MRKDCNDISDTSSSLVLAQDAKAAKEANQKNAAAQKSKLEISMDMLLGELSEIKMENGINQLEEELKEPSNTAAQIDH